MATAESRPLPPTVPLNPYRNRIVWDNIKLPKLVGTINKSPTWLASIQSRKARTCQNILNAELAQDAGAHGIMCAPCIRLGIQCVVAPSFQRCARCTRSGNHMSMFCNLDVQNVLQIISDRLVINMLHVLR